MPQAPLNEEPASMPSWKTIWENIFQSILELYKKVRSGWDVIWASLQPIHFKDVLTFLFSLITILVAFQAFDLQRKSSEQTVRMEMANELTSAFSEQEMYEAINYFLGVSSHLTDAKGKPDEAYIKEINENPATKKYRYRILTTLHHAERLYKTEKANTSLFTSLITPDIVEVTLYVLPKLDDFTNGVDVSVYKMVYTVFEDIRTSYLNPYWDAIAKEKIIELKRLQHTRRILISLQTWDQQWGDESDRIHTKQGLILIDFLEGFTNSDLKQFKEAIKYYTRVINLDPQFSSAYFNRGSAKAKLKQYRGALQDYNKALELGSKTCSGAYSSRGNVRIELKQYRGAIQDYDIAIELDSKDATNYNNRGFAKHNLQKNKEAIEDYTKAIALKPDFALTYNNRGEAYEKIGKHKEAQADFAEYKRLKDLKQ
jgi:tetratricopeptide (TPR) repeat protein